MLKYKIQLLTCLLIAGCIMTAKSQQPNISANKKEYKPGYAWTLSYPLGQHVKSDIDTLLYNYQRQAVPSMTTDAFLTTGNLGAPGETLIFFNRPASRQFFFANTMLPWIPTESTQKFYNVYVPMTLLSYNIGGDKDAQQDRLRGTFAGNVNRRFGITASIDYIYSKGSYNYQAVKGLPFQFGAYYNGDRYEAQAFLNQYNMLVQENGGITDDRYITDPASIQGGVNDIEAKSIPTRLSKAHSRLVGSEIFFNQAYKIGYWSSVQVNDTLSREVYVPVTKFIHTLRYNRGRHVFDNRRTQEAKEFWTNTYLTDWGTHDETRQWSLSNTLGITTIEGFRPWAKFALGAYATYEYMRTDQTWVPADMNQWSENRDLTPLPFNIPSSNSQNRIWIGGQLNKESGHILNYRADAKFGIAGDVIGDIDINAEASSRLKLLGDTVELKVNGFFRNLETPYLLQHYVSNHFAWDNNFGKTRSLRVAGELTIPWTHTVIKAGVENIQNLVYFGPDALPRQHGGSVQIINASLLQKLRFGIWNWDNSLTLQTCSDESVIPLPKFSIYSNMYLNFIAFRVLHIQTGIDCDYYTRYNAMGYQPATMSFHTSDSGEKVGNYPFFNFYVTCKLYKTRFFVMVSHLNQGWGSKNYFSMPGYPLNPRHVQVGLAVDFSN